MTVCHESVFQGENMSHYHNREAIWPFSYKMLIKNNVQTSKTGDLQFAVFIRCCSAERTVPFSDLQTCILFHPA